MKSKRRKKTKAKGVVHLTPEGRQSKAPAPASSCENEHRLGD